MGAAMARRVAAAGHTVRVWNRTAASAEALAAADEGRRTSVAASPAEAVLGADVVLTMLADGDVTCAVLLDSTVQQAVQPETVVVDLGTSGVDASARLADGFAQTRRRYVDAPVSGSVPAVDAGTLLIMASGEAADVDAAREVLGAFAKAVLHLGPSGAGQAMKLAVNLVVHDLNAALSESLVLAESAGISRDVAYDVLQQSVVAAPFVQYKRAAFLDADVPVAMSLALVEKDLRLVLELAQRGGVPASATEAVHGQVAAAVEAGRGGEDMAALSRFLRDRRVP
jgi:3-hydroxyisobutyrate dehydrogenase-like beta-hydroxyacid dehydrogenase